MEPILAITAKSDQEIAQIFKENSVALSPEEGRQVVQMLGRNPTLTEAMVWGIQGSEHCSYKSSKDYLRQLPTTGKEVLLGPGEDAGVVKFHESKTSGEVYGIVYAHESHNHPSQVVPFEGAATGVGGICRDIACMGARVIGALDSLRFGDLDRHETKRIASGVVAGVGGYGNPLGVPNLGGEAYFEESFNSNCLVNVVALGVLKWKNIIHSVVPENAARDGYDLILVGKPTDRSGFGGASFASANLEEEDKDKNKGAVQEPNPFLERHLFAAFYDLFGRLEQSGDLQRIAFKDLGAGGILCASVELVAEAGFGALVDVKNIHVAEDNLPAAVILCAETQERFCFAVPPELTEMLLEHFNTRWDFPHVSAGARASVIGKVTSSGYYIAKYQGEEVCHAKALDITRGITVSRPLAEPVRRFDPTPVVAPADLKAFFLRLLSSENICSLRPFTETYDQTVQGNTVLTRDEADAVVFAPLRDFPELPETEQELCAAVSVAGPARVGRLDPKKQGELAVVQSVLKVVAAGGKPLALTDCLNYGNPEIPEQMWELVEGIKGLKSAAEALKAPFVSGNVSLYNCSKSGSVSASAIVSCLGKLPEAITPRGNRFRAAGNEVWLLGPTSSDVSASEALWLLNHSLGDQPQPLDVELYARLVELVLAAGSRISAASLVADGGVAAALMKMSARSGIGADIQKSFSFAEWFAETPRLIVEVAPEDAPVLKSLAMDMQVSCASIGITTGQTLNINGVGEFAVAELCNIYEGSLRQKK